MSDHDPIGIHSLRQWAWEYAVYGMIAGPRRLCERTIGIIASLSVQLLFSVLRQQQRLSPRDAKALYPAVHYGVYTRLQRQYG